MEWLIPLGASILGGLFGGQNQSQTSTTQNLSPELQAAVNKIFGEAGKIYEKPYTKYTGQRVAEPTQSRESLTPLLDSIGGAVNDNMTDASGSRARIGELSAPGPSRISVPSMVQGGASVNYTPRFEQAV